MHAAATFCATLVDEWGRLGVTDAVVCPGSRSTPLAVALADDADVRVHVHHDERSGAFCALGLGLATGRPAVVLTTSGTATVNLHPAVVEADLSGVPVLVCTADRPPHLQARGAPQTIRQTDLYGSSVRRFVDAGVPDADGAGSWRELARTAWAAATGLGGRPGPVQVNLPFDEPLVGDAGPLPPPLERAGDAGVESPATLSPRLAGRGVVVAGRSTAPIGDVVALADELGWPLLADPRAGARPDRVIAHADLLLRHEPTASRLRPDVVLRVGEAPASRVLNEWLRDSGAHEVAIADRFLDPWCSADEVLIADPASTVRAWIPQVEQRADPEWQHSWAAVERAARRVVAELADVDPLDEIGVARTVAAEVPSHGALVVAASMPIRDVEWFAAPRDDAPPVYSNRGANGIDGVTSTAVGVALSGRSTVALLGDVAFLHDSSALTGLRHRPIDLTLVVVDNDGGGIFSFLPQAADLGPDRFEQLFGTPHGTDLVSLARAHHVDAERVTTRDELAATIAEPGIRVVVVPTDRAENVARHRAITSAVAAALDDL